MIKVLGARCLVKEIKKDDDKTLSGIILPGSDKEPTYTGVVISVGEGAILDNGIVVPMKVKEGDKIVYTAFSGSPIVVEDETFLVLNERDILCILVEDDKE